MSFPRKIDDSLEGRVQDMIKALDSEAFLSSLSLALSLPDICGKYLYPEDKSSARYAKWFDQYVAHNYSTQTENSERNVLCYFDGEDCYQLRCVFLHEGSNAPHVGRGKTTYNVAQFRIFGTELMVGVDHIGRHWSTGREDEAFNQVDLDLVKFIHAVAAGVRTFLGQHPDANNLNPINGLQNIFYSPILDFR